MRVFLVLGVLVLAGCTGASPEAAAGTSASLAQPAVPQAEAGSLTGLVVDDEQTPIEGAEVAILSIDNSTKTDKEGRFTFNGLEAGTYQVSVQKVGYAAVGKKVEIRVGEVTRLTVALQPFVIVESFLDSRPITSYIKFGESFVDIATHETPLVGNFCDACHVYVHIKPRPTAAIAEFVWTPSVGVSPAVNDDVFFTLCRDFQNGTTLYRCGDSASTGTIVSSAYMKNRQGRPMAGNLFANATLLRLDIHAGQSVAYELRLTTWLSFAYNQELPTGYSALPPK